MSSLTVQALHKHFGAFHAIKGADVSVAEGEFVTLLGESGCGKTTTLRCIAGLETPTSGLIQIGDRTVFDHDRRIEIQPEKREAGMVFQSYALWPHLTVIETVLYPLRRRRVKGKEAIRRAREMLEIVGLEPYATRPATSLSGGQQQRVALARALVSRPQLMLYDEPLSNLDPSLRRQVRDEILRLHTMNGATSVYVTHDLEEAMHLSDRIIVMQAGLLEQTGTPAEIFSKPTNEFVAKFVGFENLLEAKVTAVRGGEIELELPATGARAALPVTSASGPVAVGNDVNVAFRSANALVHGQAPDGSTGRLTFPGTIERVDFLGSRNEYRISSGTATLRVAESEREYRQQAMRREQGATAWVDVDAEFVTVIPARSKGSARSTPEPALAGTPS
ncbi:ABC transporter ATP-binding protein [Pseudoclavibacter endophyticus]|uniref:ABC transporter ATP-binding protein n=1 Tax=Pseudoclavibacter endophyticus TaxID=1778590 RepID=UPI0016641E00|nr:ABC transporter ATP-binding protein [Pseudoclavibacter endophyticus]GGA64942.1 ABC transporter ATP-binding protein [Pseudoclavibacter endophyticus]